MFLLQKCTMYNIFYTFATIKFSTKYTLSLHTLGQNLVNQNEKVTHENPHWLLQKVAIKNWKINKSSKSSVRQTTEKTALRFLGAKQVDIGTIFDVICLTSINIE